MYPDLLRCAGCGVVHRCKPLIDQPHHSFFNEINYLHAKWCGVRNEAIYTKLYSMKSPTYVVWGHHRPLRDEVSPVGKGLCPLRHELRSQLPTCAHGAATNHAR